MTEGGRRRALTFTVITGEESGDALGAGLMAALKTRAAATGTSLCFVGVGGEAMAREGLESIFPLADVAVMGPLAILARLPKLVRRVHQAVDAALAAAPDCVVIIDAPELTHPIARRIRRRRPAIPIVDYVSPSVWAWRPGRARRMRGYVDHVLALLPFEPAAHARLGGPPCTYVGHPLIERLDALAALDPAPLARRLALGADRPVLVVLPGSRTSEVGRLLAPFAEAVGLLAREGPAPEVVIPTLPHVRGLVEAGLGRFPVRPHLIEGEEDKLRAFKLARAALAASGTVTLELALAGTPMVVAYKVDALAARLRFLLKVRSIVLANLVLEENAFPELVQERCTPEGLAAALAPLLTDTPARRAQLAALAGIAPRMRLPSGSPSEAAAEIVWRHAMRAASL
jgi:lipid-A-disaccharide synthase